MVDDHKGESADSTSGTRRRVRLSRPHRCIFLRFELACRGKTESVTLGAAFARVTRATVMIACITQHDTADASGTRHPMKPWGPQPLSLSKLWVWPHYFFLQLLTHDITAGQPGAAPNVTESERGCCDLTEDLAAPCAVLGVGHAQPEQTLLAYCKSPSSSPTTISFHSALSKNVLQPYLLQVSAQLLQLTHGKRRSPSPFFTFNVYSCGQR